MAIFNRIGYLSILLLWFVSDPALAHAPHDDVFDIAVSPNFAEDRRVFAIVRSALLVSNDGGTSWGRVVNGLDHRHMLYALDSAGDGQTMYLTSLGDGIFVSRDGGHSWSQVNRGLELLAIDLVAASPHSSDVAFAADVKGGLYRTSNGGQQWEIVKGPFGKVTAAAYLPDDTRGILIGDHRGNLFRSNDGGDTWQKLLDVGPATGIGAVAVFQQDGGTSVIAAGTSDGRVLISEDGGLNFKIVRVSATSEPLMSLAISPKYGEDRSIFASVWDEGVLSSIDGGKTWQSRNHGLTRHSQSTRLGRPSFSHLRLTPSYEIDSTVFLAGFDGVFRSTDAGQTWEWQETLSMLNIVSLSLSPYYDDDRTVALTTYLWGNYLSHDAGAKWRSVNRGAMDHPRSQGLTRLFQVSFSPNYSEDRTVFTSTWYRLLRSTDGGRRWEELPPVVLPEGARRDHGSFYSFSSAFPDDNTVAVAAGRVGIVLISTDRGRTFEIVLESPGSTIASMQLSPNFPEDRTIFAGDQEGVHVSRDAGETWAYRPLVPENMLAEFPISVAYPATASGGWAQHLDSHREVQYGIQILISPNYASDQTVFAATPYGLARSIDGGDNWDFIDDGSFPVNAYIETVNLSPNFANDQTLIVSIRGKGLYRSEDGGESFSEIASDLLNRQVLFGHFPGMTPKYPAIVFSPQFEVDNTLYGYSGDDLLRSFDAGETWEFVTTPVPGPFTRAHAWLRYARYQHISKRRLAAAFVVLLLLGGTIGVVVRKYRKSEQVVIVSAR